MARGGIRVPDYRMFWILVDRDGHASASMDNGFYDIASASEAMLHFADGDKASRHLLVLGGFRALYVDHANARWSCFYSTCEH